MTDFPIQSTFEKQVIFELERTAEARRTLLEEHSAAFRWLLASLLAVNGGAVLFSKEAIASGDTHALTSGGIFLLGIVAALMAGWLSQRANRGLIEPLAKVTTFWFQVLEADEFDEAEFNKLTNVMEDAMKAGRPTQICGWISALAFVIGAVVLGLGFRG